MAQQRYIKLDDVKWLIEKFGGSYEEVSEDEGDLLYVYPTNSPFEYDWAFEIVWR